MGPLGVVVIVVVVVCLMSSSWLCFMMHRRTQASTSKIAQVWVLSHTVELPWLFLALSVLSLYNTCCDISVQAPHFCTQFAQQMLLRRIKTIVAILLAEVNSYVRA